VGKQGGPPPGSLHRAPKEAFDISTNRTLDVIAVQALRRHLWLDRPWRLRACWLPFEPVVFVPARRALRLRVICAGAAPLTSEESTVIKICELVSCGHAWNMPIVTLLLDEDVVDGY
jgi:hypothetical protein